MGLKKPSYPPLFPAGLHDFTLQQLRKKCVDPFPKSLTRPSIMDGLEHVVGKLKASRIVGELWIDGGFVTRSPDPEDVDCVLKLDGPTYDAFNPRQMSTVNWFNAGLKADHHCDSYVFAMWPAGHPLEQEGAELRAYWLGQFAFDRCDQPKGMARISL